MNYLDDTIAAISTPAGEGGIGIVRLSGADAINIAGRIFYSPKGKRLKDVPSRSVVYGFIVDPVSGKSVDEALVTVMRAPKTYTAEDVVEINCHGGMLPVKAILTLILREGARLAEPGEFTKRAFLNGRIDLAQAEAVIDIIKAKTDRAERLAMQQLEGRLSGRIKAFQEEIAELCSFIEAYIDFPEDEIEVLKKSEIISSIKKIDAGLEELSKGYDEGRFFREGVSAAIVGKPNAGKSSLLNTLLEKDRAIVTDMPGTTRDVIEDYLNIKGLPLRVMDTAGIRESHNLAEKEGVKRSLKAIDGADIVIAVLDASKPVDDSDMELLDKIAGKKTIILVNKCDVESPDFNVPEGAANVIRCSALRGEGIGGLKEMIYSLCISSPAPVESEEPLVTNIRHKHAIDRAAESLKASLDSLEKGEPLEITAMFLREALGHTGSIIGAVTTEDILNRIFANFCIGK